MSEIDFHHEINEKPLEIISKNLREEFKRDPKAKISKLDIELSFHLGRAKVIAFLCENSYFWGQARKEELKKAIKNPPALNQIIKEEFSAIAHQ